MPRLIVIPLASLLIVSGCGSAEMLEDEPAEATVVQTSTTEPETTTTGSAVSTTSTSPPATTPRPPLLDGLPAPDITLDLDDEAMLALADSYEPVMLFFWATWCHNCHEMMPLIDQLSVDYRERTTVVAVARLSKLHDIESDVIEYLPSGATRWVSDEDNAISESFRIPGNPVTILVVGGVETDRWLGLASVADIRARLDEVLGLYD